MKKPKIISLEVYPYDTAFFYGDFEKLRSFVIAGGELQDSEIEELQAKKVTGWHRGMCLRLKNGGTAVWVPEKPETPEQFGYLAHEIFHAVAHVLDRIDIPLTNDTEEAYAYLIGYITKRIYEIIGAK